MILFHLPRIDSGDLRAWRRAILPACRLRRTGVAAKIAAGDVPAAQLTGASGIVLCGAFDASSVAVAHRAREAGVRVVMDLADTRSLTVEIEAARRVAQAAHVVVAGNDALATLAAAHLGLECACRVIADAPIKGFLETAAAFPILGSRLAADAIKLRAIDAVRRLRGRLRGARPQSAGGGFCIAWFGDGSGLEQEGGLGELLLATGDLVDLSEELQFRLRVIGTSRRLFRRTIGRLPIETEFRRLTIPTLARDLRDADLCFLPAAGDAVSRARSAMRAEIACSLGIPVLTAEAEWQAPPGLTPTADWLPRLRSFPTEKRGPMPPPAVDDGADIVSAWRDAIVAEPAAAKTSVALGDGRSARRILFLLQQVQDLDLICPIAEAACVHAAFEVHVAVLTKIAIPASRRLLALRERGAQLRFWRGQDLIDGAMRITPGDFDAAVTASDGAGGGARYAAAFVRAANAAGIQTLNIQHGLDNTGLTYGPPPAAPFNAGLVLTWGGLDRLSEAADEATRAKVIPVGCPKRRLSRDEAADFPLAGQKFIAVFENLHWRRYGADYRQRFVQDLSDAAIATPDLTFVLKPHMGGRWFTREHAERPLPPNLLVADPGSRQWHRFSADSFLAHASAVITTPSTIALDAARYDLPTAVVAYGIGAENYAPLFRIEAAGDWLAFVRQVRDGAGDMAAVHRFRAAATVPGDALARALTVIRLSAEGKSRADILAALEREAPPALT